MGNDRTPVSQHNVWRYHNYDEYEFRQEMKAGNSELKTVSRNEFKNIRYYASSGYLQVL